MAELSKEAKKARAAYQKQWAHKNPDKIREYNRKHWEKVAKSEAKP